MKKGSPDLDYASEVYMYGLGIGTIPKYLRTCVLEDDACIQAISNDPNIRIDGVILDRLSEERESIRSLEKTLDTELLRNIKGDYCRDMVEASVNAREALRMIQQDDDVQTWHALEQRLTNAFDALIRFRDRYFADHAAAHPPQRFRSLLNIAPLIKQISHLVLILWETLANDTPWPDDVDSVGLSQGNRESLEKQTLPLSQLLQDPRIQALETSCFTRMEQALELMARSQAFEDWRSVESQLDMALDELNRFVQEQSTKAFGQAASIYSLITNNLPQESLELLAAACQRDFDPSHLASIVQPELDETTFTVTCGNRKSCKLGNTKRFRLLQLLLASPNRFVSFLDLAEGLGGDAQDADSLPATKCRLCDQLRSGGYSDLVGCIKTQPQHYGFFFRP